MKILITCFEPFDKKQNNSSYDVMQGLIKSYSRENYDIFYQVLPVSYIRSIQLLRECVLHYKPDAIISIGESNKTEDVLIEKYAVNLMHSLVADNDNNIIINQKISNNYPSAISSKIDIYQFVEKVNLLNPDIKMSLSAGSYVCNRVMFEGILLEREYQLFGSLFVHVPHFEKTESYAVSCLNTILNEFINNFMEKQSINKQ